MARRLAAARRRCSSTRTYYQSLVVGGASQRIRRSFARNPGTLVLTRDISIVLNFGGTPSNPGHPVSLLSAIADSEASHTRSTGLVSSSADIKRHSLHARRVDHSTQAASWPYPRRTRACCLNICRRPHEAILFASNYGVA